MQKFVKQIGTLSFANIFVAMSGIISIPIFTKTVGASGYGIWVQIKVTAMFTVSLITLGLPYSIVRFLPSENNNESIKDRFYSIVILVAILGIAFSFIMLLVSEYIAYFLDCELKLVYMLPMMVLIESLILVCIGYMRAYQWVKLHVFTLIARVYGEVLVAYILFQFQYGLFCVLAASIVVRFLVLICVITFITKSVQFSLPKFIHIKDMLKFSLPTMPVNFSTWIVNISDRYVINFFLGSVYVGYYVPGYALGSIIEIASKPIGQILPSKISALYDNNQIDEVRGYLKNILNVFLLLAIPATGGLFVISKNLLCILSTNEIANKGYLIVLLSSLGYLFFGIYVIYLQVIVMVKKTKIISYIWLLAAVFNVLFNVILVIMWGIIGAAISSVVSFFVSFLLVSYFARRYIKINIDLFFIGKIISATMFMVILLMLFPWLPLAVKVAMGVIVYILFLFIFKAIKVSDIYHLKNIVFHG